MEFCFLVVLPRSTCIGGIFLTVRCWRERAIAIAAQPLDQEKISRCSLVHWLKNAFDGGKPETRAAANACRSPNARTLKAWIQQPDFVDYLGIGVIT